MKKSSQALIWVIAALVLFAIGRIGYGAYQAKHTTDIQNGTPPVIQDTN